MPEKAAEPAAWRLPRSDFIGSEDAPTDENCSEDRAVEIARRQIGHPKGAPGHEVPVLRCRPSPDVDRQEAVHDAYEQELPSGQAAMT